ncbi:MAG: hypothetical protein HQK94_08205 [Nitrospirae bacterium]|nr:hypothetical protein [Nitrospirota bacterium]
MKKAISALVLVLTLFGCAATVSVPGPPVVEPYPVLPPPPPGPPPWHAPAPAPAPPIAPAPPPPGW